MKNTSITSDSFWIRTIYMLLFAIIYGLADIAVVTIAIIQWVHTLVTGDSNDRLDEFMSSLAQYLRSIVAFLGYSTEEKPFPFADWPDPDNKS